MKESVRIASIIGAIIAILAIAASLSGLFYQPLYDDAHDAGVFPEELHPGTFSQDLITVPVAIGLLVLSIFHLIGVPNIRTRIVQTGLIGYLLYGYGLLTIGGTFTSIYPLYILILGGSTYSMILSLMSFSREEISLIHISNGIRKGTAVYLLIVVAAFTLLWFMMLIPASIDNERIETYPVFVMDLCIVMPFFLFNAIMLLKRTPLGTLLMGVALVKIVTLILSVLIGESLASNYDMEPNLPMIVIYSVILIISTGLLQRYIRSIDAHLSK